MSTLEDTTPAEPVFRASKRRKVFRRRDESPEAATGVTQEVLVTQEHALPQDDDTDLPQLGSLVRQRKMSNRRGGIVFSNDAHKTRNVQAPSSHLTVPLAEEKASVVEQAARRFTAQTGLVAETHDKHMTTFIEAELARLRSGDPLTGPSDDHYDHPTSASLPRPVGVHPQRQPAVVGKLQEVDLGPSAALKNIALTEAATRRLHGTPSEERKPPEKILLGRDGKPRRRRYRRPSDALKRDAIVEEIMRESKLDVYEPPNASPPANADANNDQPDDDRFAEQFKRDFMDAMATRNAARRHANKAAGASVAAGAEAKKSRGPKLGGSRSARAAMKALEEKAGVKR